MSNKKYNKKKTNENILDAARKFSDAFFDGLKKGAEDKVIQRAEKAGIERRALEKMKQIKKEKEELEKILADIPKA